ncbi:MBL fold metallo-hydrolase [Candidatus Woesearchaeota archaeon]|nr:MBL fold metallo-hydrolase [Candidatus Woesearchaeota archaeon]
MDIKKLNHDSVMISGSVVIYFDPFKLDSDVPADIIFITHEHFDHCSPDDIKKLRKATTVIVAPEECRPKLEGDIRFVKPGDKIEVKGINIEAVPAYNLNKFRSPGVPFHPKSDNKVGYVVTVDGKRLYHAGDTDNIPEMSKLGDIDIAFLPVSGTYVMTPEEAAEACSIIRPKLAVPMHYGDIVGSSSDAERFKSLATCKVEIL